MLKFGSAAVRIVRATNDFHALILFSTSTAKNGTQFVVDYLVNSLGFSEEAALSTSKKVNPFKSSQNPNSVVNFLKKYGLDQSQVRNVVFAVPRIMSSDVDKTLKPKIKVFEDLGLSGSALADAISANPTILSRPLGSHIVPAIDALKAVFSDENLIRAIKRSQWMLSNATAKYLLPNFALLRSHGFSVQQIQKYILQKPRQFVQKTEWHEKVLRRVEDELGIPCGSPSFLYGVHLLSSFSEKTIESKIQVFKRFGWTESNILTMAQRFPGSLALSESKIEQRLKFFMKELGFDSAFLAARPAFLKYSLENRVVPRHAVLGVLKEKGLIKSGCPLYNAVCLSESEFLRKFVLPFEDAVPNLKRVYIDNMGSAVETAK